MKIGVIGGNGVAATNRLCDMVECKIVAAGAFRDAHHPEMIVWQATGVPSRSMFLEGLGPDWRPDYIRIARALKDLGCDYGCMCCNTAHYAIDEVVKGSGLGFVNLLEKVALSVKERHLRKVVMFCSDGARKFDLYGNVFRRICPEVELAYPSEARQLEVTKIICAVKTKERFTRDPARMLEELSEGEDAPVVLGCTDLRVAFPSGAPLKGNIVLDSLECLADAIVEKHMCH